MELVGCDVDALLASIVQCTVHQTTVPHSPPLGITVKQRLLLCDWAALDFTRLRRRVHDELQTVRTPLAYNWVDCQCTIAARR